MFNFGRLNFFEKEKPRPLHEEEPSEREEGLKILKQEEQEKYPWEDKKIVEEKYENVGRVGNYLVIKITQRLKNGQEKNFFAHVHLCEVEPTFRGEYDNNFIRKRAVNSSTTDYVDLKSLAKKDLIELGLEVNVENIGTVLRLRSVRQLPEAPSEDKQEKLNELYSYLAEYNRQPSPEQEAELSQLMQQADIKSIIHSEGLTVWEHTRKTIQAIEKLKIEDKLKQELKIVMLYHDLGKAEVYNQPENKDRTQQKLKQGIVHQTMIGHEKAAVDKIQQGLQANHLSGTQLEKYMLVIAHHMRTDLMDCQPKVLYELLESFGRSEAEIKNALKLLVLVLNADGQGTEKIKLTPDGKLVFSQGETKANFNFGDIWQRYQQTKQDMAEQAQAKAAEKEQFELEQSVCGGKLSDYLIRTRKVKPGPSLGRAIKQARQIIQTHRQLPPEQIRQLLDETGFELD